MTEWPMRGEVWLVAFDPTVGAEIQKTRPAVVLSSDHFAHIPMRLVAPFTSWQPRFATHGNKLRIGVTPTNGLSNDSAADIMQMRGVSTERFIRRLGQLHPDDVAGIAAQLAITIEHF